MKNREKNIDTLRGFANLFGKFFSWVKTDLKKNKIEVIKG